VLHYVETIDAGEAQAIVLAIELKATLLIDEVAGRAAAAAAGVPYMGVLGVLLLAKRQRLISEVRPLLDRLRVELPFRIAQKLYDQFLKSIGEM
jgi:predicted nucleic acid-binding protein